LYLFLHQLMHSANTSIILPHQLLTVPTFTGGLFINLTCAI
jgi:hypothetical protein